MNEKGHFIFEASEPDQVNRRPPWCQSWSCWSFPTQRFPGGSWPSEAAAPRGTASSGPPGSPRLSVTPPELLRANSGQASNRRTDQRAPLTALKPKHVLGQGCTSFSFYSPYLHFCWARYRQTVRSWWSARGGPAPGEASPLSGQRHRYSPHGSRWQMPSSRPGSGSPARHQQESGGIVQKNKKQKTQPSSKIHVATCVVNSVSFFLLMVLSSMVSGTDRLTILLCRSQERKHQDWSHLPQSASVDNFQAL